MNKILSSILIPALLIHLVGCYSFQEVTQEEFVEAETEDYVDLKIVTNTAQIYKFDEGNYTIKEDSISGTGTIEIPFGKGKNAYKDFNGSISLGDIESINFDRFNGWITLLVLAVVVGTIALIASGIKIGGLGKGFNAPGSKGF